MNTVAAESRFSPFKLLKYTVYLLLAANVGLFFLEEWNAAAHKYPNGIAVAEFITAFAATIDTIAWVVLLLLFELETYQIPDDKLTPRLVATLHGVRIVCMAAIIYAFYGYVAELMSMGGYQLVASEAGIRLCNFADQSFSWMTRADSFEVLSVANCETLNAQQAVQSVYQLQGSQILTSGSILEGVRWLAWVDVINSGSWILVVVVLELDVRLQVRDRFFGWWPIVSRYLKYVLYTTLLLAAVYWGFEGKFIDFWDAFLWLVAFAFIELNVLQWREELRDETREEQQS